MAVFEWAGFGLLRRERQYVGAQAGRRVGYRQADDVGLAGVREAVVDFDRGVNLLLGLVHGDQIGRRFDLGEQG